jgi:hypothetical protein
MSKGSEFRDISQGYEGISLEDWKILTSLKWPTEVDETIGLIESQGTQGDVVPENQVAIINSFLDKQGLKQYRLLDGKEEWTEGLQKFYKIT